MLRVPYARGAEPELFAGSLAPRLVPGTAGTAEKLLQLRGEDHGPWHEASLRLLVERDGKLVEKRNFGRDTVASVVRATPPVISRQRLYVDPTTGKLYVAEGDSGVMKSFKQLVEIDPETGKIALIELPLTAEDMAFDLRGLIYLRTDTEVARYEFKTWREVPFDYGEERQRVGFDLDSAGRGAPLVSGLPLPGSGRPGCFHLGDALYALASPTRVLDGQPNFLPRTETLLKVRPTKTRLLSEDKTIPLTLSEGTRPARAPDLQRGAPLWVEGAEWMYGGVGFGGFNPGGGGNVDDGLPLVAGGGPPTPRSIGHDEVALFHAAYVATHMDRRLFIADAGNARIVSVKLGYHAQQQVALKNVPDRGQKKGVER